MRLHSAASTSSARSSPIDNDSILSLVDASSDPDAARPAEGGLDIPVVGIDAAAGKLDAAVAARPGRAIAGSRVLLVDDTPDMLETFGYLLEHEGAQVTLASSGAEALRLAESEDFDLMISDVGMPVMDGYQLIAELRKRPRTAGLPAIALTGHGRQQDIERALQSGFDAHVGKPVDFAHMRSTMASVLAGAPIAGRAPDPS